MKKKLMHPQLKRRFPSHANPRFTSRYFFEKILPSYLPAVIAGFALVIALMNGLFETKSQRLELQKEKLQYDISKFTEERASLVRQNQQLIMYKAQTSNLAMDLLKDVDKFITQKDKFPCLKEQTLLTDDGRQLTTDDGEFLTSGDTDELMTLIVQLRKKISLAADSTKHFDNSFDSSFR